VIHERDVNLPNRGDKDTNYLSKIDTVIESRTGIISLANVLPNQRVTIVIMAYRRSNPF
jgi:hypothetical protein